MAPKSKVGLYVIFLILGQFTPIQTFQHWTSWIIRNAHCIAELRKTLVAELIKTWVSKNAIGQFCAKWLLRMIAQIVVFSHKTDAQRKKNFAFLSEKISQKFCEWKPYKYCNAVYISYSQVYCNINMGALTYTRQYKSS